MEICSTLLIVREIQIKQQSITSHLLGWLSSKSLQIKDEENVEKREPLYIVGGDLNWCSHYGKQYRGFQILFLNKTTIWSINFTSMILENTETLIWKDTCTKILTEILFTVAKTTAAS